MSAGNMSQTILVVDDNHDIVMITRSTLEKKGFKVVTANNGLEAIEKLKEQVPDAVILDVMMPDVSGWEVLDFIKNEETTAKVPVILMSARDRGEQVSAGYAYGADYYLTKPCTRDRLLTAVGQVLRRYDLLPGGEAAAAAGEAAGGAVPPRGSGGGQEGSGEE